MTNEPDQTTHINTSRADATKSANEFIVKVLRDSGTKNSPEMVAAIAELFRETAMN
jgi:hypothetical protein